MPIETKASRRSGGTLDHRGGQLGLMTRSPPRALGIKCHIYCRTLTARFGLGRPLLRALEDSIGPGPAFATASTSSPSIFENIPADSVRVWPSMCRVRPWLEGLATRGNGDRKTFFNDLGIETRWLRVASRANSTCRGEDACAC